MIMIIDLPMAKQLSLSKRVEAVKDTGWCLGIKGTECLLFSWNVDNVMIKSGIKLSESWHYPKTALGLYSLLHLWYIMSFVLKFIAGHVRTFSLVEKPPTFVTDATTTKTDASWSGANGLKKTKLN